MSENNKRNAASMILAVVVIVVFGLYMVAFQVPFTHTAVVTQFGEIRKTYSGLNDKEVGLQFKLPWPIEQVSLFDNRIQVYESKLEQLFTADEQSITVTVYTAWRIGSGKEEVVRFLKVLGTPENAESKLAGIAHDAMGKVVGKNSFESFVSTDPARMKFAQIEKDLYDQIAPQVRETYGIEVLSVGIKRLELPEEATKKVFDRMKQEREQLAKKYKAEGESKARQILSEANELASNIENRARAEAITITGQGDVLAAQYYKIFAENPTLHNFIKRLETLKETLPRRSTLILDAERVPPYDLLSPKSMKLMAEPMPSVTEKASQK
jgi:membrane protease subunit HflC